MTDSRAHRSRIGWADPMDEEPPEVPEHTCRLPRGVRLALIGLAASQLLTLVGLGFSVAYDYQQQQYIEGRGEYRDREAARIERENIERTRRAQCDLLDTFPEGVPSLERAREKYRCSPGIPLGLLRPDEQARYQPPQSSVALPPRTGPGPDNP